MKKYRLFIERKNFYIKNKGIVIKTGFFTNRYIEAIDNSSAGDSLVPGTGFSWFEDTDN